MQEPIRAYYKKKTLVTRGAVEEAFGSQFADGLYQGLVHLQRRLKVINLTNLCQFS